ncbi:hypothetical protein [Bradyrhizobium iriomotense]|uniref:hypothetical protein n=1 Tax=Bradyrhizobium iriomotense TaxID=441950 RepID=UPI0024E070C7|nr:hypothetical protein [Bradyrhizobium iriomotense]
MRAPALQRKIDQYGISVHGVHALEVSQSWTRNIVGSEKSTVSRNYWNLGGLFRSIG